MNRAAEKAAPKAASYFADAIKGMSIEDARKILSGGNTAATEYFKSKTSSKLYDEFKPSVSESMNQVGVTHAYNAMMGKVPPVPFAKPESVDLNHYVTTKALDGLFYMVGQEEQKIRTNPVGADNGPFEEGVRQIVRLDSLCYPSTRHRHPGIDR